MSKKLLFVVVFCLFLPDAFGLDYQNKIDPFVRHHLPHASIGMVVLEAETGKVLYERQGETYFPPASNTKILTATAALIALGADYRYATTLKADRAHQLFIQFSGDPTFTSTDLRKLISALKQKGFHKIEQDITIDSTYFQLPDYPLGWTWDSMLWYYGAPVTAIILDENQVAIKVTPNKVLGQKAEVRLLPSDTLNIHLASDLITVTPEEAKIKCQFQREITDHNDLYLSGCWPYSDSPTLLKLGIKNSHKRVEQALLAILKAEQIEFQGKIRFAPAPEDSVILATHYSPPIAELLKKVLEDSNNLYAESMLKTLGAKYFHQGTFQAGILSLKEILTKLTGSDFKDLRIFDGSGLSRYNLVTPYQLADVLRAIYRDKSLYKIFKKALPSGGKSGTLQNRMQISVLKDRIRAKTGSHLGSSTLAGYLTTLQNKQLIFVIMVDHLASGQQAAKQLEDELCRLLVVAK